MKTHTILIGAGLALAILSTLALPARADTVTLKDGSVIHGKITGISGGTIAISTGFAGDLSIKQDQVSSFETDEPVFVKTTDNSTVLGKVDCKDSDLCGDLIGVSLPKPHRGKRDACLGYQPVRRDGGYVGSGQGA